MATLRESVCCHEIPEVAAVMKEEGVGCITDHPGFAAVCLNQYVLRTCYGWFNQQYRRAISNINE
jgi:hypothetical protein